MMSPLVKNRKTGSLPLPQKALYWDPPTFTPQSINFPSLWPILPPSLMYALLQACHVNTHVLTWPGAHHIRWDYLRGSHKPRITTSTNRLLYGALLRSDNALVSVRIPTPPPINPHPPPPPLKHPPTHSGESDISIKAKPGDSASKVTREVVDISFC